MFGVESLLLAGREVERRTRTSSLQGELSYNLPQAYRSTVDVLASVGEHSTTNER